MSMQARRKVMTGCITVFGGTGFIGRHLVALLLQSGETVRLAVRHPHRIKLATGATSSPEIVRADILNETSVGSAIVGADAVFNLVGILTETSTQTYRAIHVEGARRVALAAQRHGVMRVIHMSALSGGQVNELPSNSRHEQGAAGRRRCGGPTGRVGAHLCNGQYVGRYVPEAIHQESWIPKVFLKCDRAHNRGTVTSP
jgi:uncharacterized protein YbjT (DUF2867 family)